MCRKKEGKKSEEKEGLNHKSNIVFNIVLYMLASMQELQYLWKSLFIIVVYRNRSFLFVSFYVVSLCSRFLFFFLFGVRPKKKQEKLSITAQRDKETKGHRNKKTRMDGQSSSKEQLQSFYFIRKCLKGLYNHFIFLRH